MTRRLVRSTAWFLVPGFLMLLTCRAEAGLLVTNFFFDTVDLYDDQTGALIQSGYFAPTGASLQLTGLAIDPTNDYVYVSSRFMDRIYVFDGATGRPLASAPGGEPGLFAQLPTGSQPAGLALDAGGNLYVANNGGLSISIFDSSATQIGTISDGGLLLRYPSGLAFDDQGDLFITTLSGSGVLRYHDGNLSQFAAPGANGPSAPNEVVINADGEVFVADVVGNGVVKYASDGSEITAPGGGPFINVELPNIPPTATHPNAPSGLAFDENGNLLVAVLGPANPFNPPYENHGALLRYDSQDGTLLQSLGYGLPPLSGLDSLPERIPGDASCDGWVDETDAAILAANWGLGDATRAMGDFDGDGVVGACDAAILAANWNPAPVETIGVPEPSLSISALVLSLVMLFHRRRQ